MGAMEKKRLLSALIAAALAAQGTSAAAAENPVSLRGVRTKPDEAELSRARELLGDLLAPDVAGAKRALSETNSPEKKKPEKQWICCR